MAPPRQRTAVVQDDSRSEASSTTTKELKAAAAKGRKGANGVVPASMSREVKVTNVTSAPAAQGEQLDNLPRISWSDMPLEFLHSYRHAYKLTTPSAYSSEYAHNLLSRGIGLRSPTAIASQHAQLSKHDSHQTNGSSRTSLRHTNGRNSISSGDRHNRSKNSSSHDGKDALHHIVGQDRVSKNQLATAVRKHFNSAGLVEQEAIARFLYKVREEGRGRHFRLKFQP
ncbi:hypothetical protein BJX63DRAFT_16578 [Aspergillus granulosus]|uniref:Histone deacetylase complex subunit SAP30 Sin3 binding domain-containing protein n=1 Tax=Aspergillus granulosus TaxID=176169 RepID=A0ABR4H023_9EURO